MIGLARKLLAVLTPRERRQAAAVLIMIIIMALLEAISVASVMPFLGVLGNPELVHTHPMLAQIHDRLGFRSSDSFLMALGMAVFLVIMLSSAFRIATHYVMNRYLEMRRHSLGERLLASYLRQPYSYFLNRHSADMAKGVLSEVDYLVIGVLRPALSATAYSIVSLTLIGLLLLHDPWMALAIAAILGGTYGGIYLAVRGLLGRLGSNQVVVNRERFTTANEALSGIKDIKLLGREDAYLSRFRPASQRYSRNLVTIQTASELPRFSVEATALGGVVALTLVLMASHSDIATLLPTLGLYAFAGFKLIPALQRVYVGMTSLRFGTAALDNVHADLHLPGERHLPEKDDEKGLQPRRDIRLRQVSFSYDQAGRPALEDIDLVLPAGHSIALVGGTGAGKTTLVDLLLGLLRPTLGELLVDDTVIDPSNLRRWQRTLGYVPQQIFLADASVAENIALGVPAAAIDPQQVERCARLAQIHGFIVESLADGYGTPVGEDGVRLSGGQRQRIGIARALYHDPSVLVLDEATSALDGVTERAVMASIEALHGQRTIILIAHRLATVRHCDQIHLMAQGRIVASGSYSELLAQESRFRTLAEHA